jgi:hypothetical protein
MVALLAPAPNVGRVQPLPAQDGPISLGAAPSISSRMRSLSAALKRRRGDRYRSLTPDLASSDWATASMVWSCSSRRQLRPLLIIPVVLFHSALIQRGLARDYGAHASLSR